MKTQFILCAFLLLGIVGMESLEKEQFRLLWSGISGYSLPVLPSADKKDDIKCPLIKENDTLAIYESPKKDQHSITCVLFYNPGNRGFITCENFHLHTAQNSNML